jgi:hypothetical protein
MKPKEKVIKPKKRRFEIKESCNIKIDADDIKAWNIDAWNIDAWNIDAYDINAWNIDVCDIKAWNIDAYDINAWNIIQIYGTKLKVKKNVKAKVLIVYEDCDIDVKGKIDANIIKIKR